MSDLKEQLRAEFEVFWRTHRLYISAADLYRLNDGSYQSPHAERAWEGFQAARRAPAAAPAPVAAREHAWAELNFMADQLEDAAQPYEGEFADRVRGHVEDLRDFATPFFPRSTALAAAPAPAAAPIVQPVADERWTCFHCAESFTDRASAALHFGTSERQAPACTIDIAQYREMEEAARRHAEDDTDLDREIYRLRNEQHIIAQRAEEKGYARGLRDAAPTPASSTAAAKDAAKGGAA